MFTFTIPKGTNLNEFLNTHSLCVECVDASNGKQVNDPNFLKNLIESITIEPITTNDEPMTPEERRRRKNVMQKMKKKIRKNLKFKPVIQEPEKDEEENWLYV